MGFVENLIPVLTVQTHCKNRFTFNNHRLYNVLFFMDHSVHILYFASSAANKKHKKTKKNTQNVHNDYDKLQRNTACTLSYLSQ